MTQDRVLAGVVLMLGFCVTGPLIDVFSKLAAQTLPVGEVTGARFVVQAALMLPLCILGGHGLRMGPGVLGRLTLRAVFLIASTYCFVAAISVMPLADALAIVFVEPFLILLLGWALFGDAVGPRRIGACVVGFGGALLVIQPSLDTFGPVALFPLGTALFFALYMLVTRALRGMHPVPMQYHTALIGTLICAPVIAAAHFTQWPTLAPATPQGIAWIWLGGVGVASAVAHMLVTYALRFAPSATLAPLHYLEIVSAATLGYLVFGNFPGPLTWTGIGVITASGLYIIQRERRGIVRDLVAGPTAD
ncbi:MAG: EamA family transporter [Limimaricola sp.]|uniref:DMT family transporter n=1 Tax=Limimaricola sp. TaxID=2211665 RepID=UPI001DCA1B6B|nr:DMT family transporter [Limimaricola sp.]MBI1416548.1 EamA family transporter [Limimaricola sp.]